MTRLLALPLFLVALALPAGAQVEDQLATVSASISAGAAVLTGADGQELVVRSMLLRSDTAGVVVFKDGASGDTVANVYLAANANLELGPEFFGPGLRLSDGNDLHATLGSASLTALIRYNSGRQQPGPERFGTFSDSISSGAEVLAGVAGRGLVVRSMLLRSSGAGVVVLRSGGGSGTVLAKVYLAANTPLVLGEDLLGDAIATDEGDGLHAELSGATLSAVFRYELDGAQGLGARLAALDDSISSGAAVIAAAPPREIVVERMLLRSSGAGVVVFRDGGASGDVLLNLYFPANSNLELGPEVFGDGVRTSAGNSLFATLSGATLSGAIRYRLE